MNGTDDIFGSDIILDEDGQAVIAANGEFVWCDGLTATVQDIRLRVFTRLGGLFYDRHFGSTIPDFIHDDNTNRLIGWKRSGNGVGRPHRMPWRLLAARLGP